MMQGVGQKIVEWAVVAALVGVIGYLIGNSEATMMKAEIAALSRDNSRHESEIAALEARLRILEPRVQRLDTLSEVEREKRKEQQ
jgi:hypothetical protein